MSDKPENPQAFPGPDDVWMADSPHGGGAWASSYGQTPHHGMTLRDYFAAKAIPAVYQSDGGTVADAAALIGIPTTDYKYNEHWAKVVAIEAYKLADAMLAERNK